MVVMVVMVRGDWWLGWLREMDDSDNVKGELEV